MDRLNKADDIVRIDFMVETSASDSESILHKSMKKWVAIENYENGIPLDAFEFEKKIKYDDSAGRKFRYTLVDVFVNYGEGKAYYCQCKNDYQWLYKFLKHIPAIKKYAKEIFVVIPENQEMIDPMRFRQFVIELKRVGVKVLSAPFHIDVEHKDRVTIELTYGALAVLVGIKNRFRSGKYLCDFIEKDLEKIIEQKVGFPYS